MDGGVEQHYLVHQPRRQGVVLCKPSHGRNPEGGDGFAGCKTRFEIRPQRPFRKGVSKFGPRHHPVLCGFHGAVHQEAHLHLPEFGRNQRQPRSEYVEERISRHHVAAYGVHQRAGFLHLLHIALRGGIARCEALHRGVVVYARGVRLRRQFHKFFQGRCLPHRPPSETLFVGKHIHGHAVRGAVPAGCEKRVFAVGRIGHEVVVGGGVEREAHVHGVSPSAGFGVPRGRENVKAAHSGQPVRSEIQRLSVLAKHGKNLAAGTQESLSQQLRGAPERVLVP